MASAVAITAPAMWGTTVMAPWRTAAPRMVCRNRAQAARVGAGPELALAAEVGRLGSWATTIATVSPKQICARQACAMLRDLGSMNRSEEHTSELQSLRHLVCRL